MDDMRTVVKWPGSKWRLAEWIISQMPPHHGYLEPFFGSGAVFFRKPASRIETVNDIDQDIYNLFQCIRKNAGLLCKLVEATPYSRREYMDVYPASEYPEQEPFERARRFLVRAWMGHGFRICHRTGWKNDISGREYAYAVRYWNALPGWIQQVVGRLKEAQIENAPAVDIIRRMNRKDVLIYADPPYLLSTRNSKKQYNHEMTDADHVELLETLLQHQGPVMLSGYANELYDTMLQGWDARSIHTTVEKGLPRVETLWLNQVAAATCPQGRLEDA
jgi:DNA adenine methylase